MMLPWVLKTFLCSSIVPIALAQPISITNSTNDLSGVPLDPSERPNIQTIVTYGGRKTNAGFLVYLFLSGIDSLWRSPHNYPLLSARTVSGEDAPPGNSIEIFPERRGGGGGQGQMKVSDAAWGLLNALENINPSGDVTKKWAAPAFSIVLVSQTGMWNLGSVSVYTSGLRPELVARDHGSQESVQGLGSQVSNIDISVMEVFSRTIMDFLAPLHHLNRVLKLLRCFDHIIPVNSVQSLVPGSYYTSPDKIDGERLYIHLAEATDVTPGSYTFGDLAYGLRKMLLDMSRRFGEGNWCETKATFRLRIGENAFAAAFWSRDDPFAFTTVGKWDDLEAAKGLAQKTA